MIVFVYANLNSLKKGLNKNRLSVILEEGKKRGHKTPLGAYINIILRANKEAYMEVNKMWQESLYEFLEETGTIANLQEVWKEQGMEQGMERGIERGMEKTARNLLSMGMPIEDIARASELPVEKIRSLAAVTQ